MKIICAKEKCYGCAACYNACGCRAISMQEDEIGHLYPRIDETKCRDCGLCQKVCPVNEKPRLDYPLKCYAVAYTDVEKLMSCASGGAATILSCDILSKGGVVYGCDGTDIRNVHHTRIDSLSDVDRLKGSKYVQSSIGTIYTQVRDDLKQDRLVLFIGTPCQVAGLKGFLMKKYYDNLITVDLVCHGVPSQKMLNDNIALYTSDKDVEVSFRTKHRTRTKQDAIYRILFGWFYRTNHTSDKSVEYWRDPYMTGFLSCATFRDSCYSCRYATMSRCSDFTLGDFWGLAKNLGIENGRGVSEVMVNSEKGYRIWESVSKSFFCMERDIVEAQCGNGQLQRPSHKPRGTMKFRKLYPVVGLVKAIRRGLWKERAKVVVREMKKKVRQILSKA